MTAILSIQSHVAYGYVGNRAAVFPLQRLGFDAWAINTVQFSNHTGYGEWTGDVFTADHVAAVLDGIAARDVLGQCAAVLSGYMGDAALGASVLSAVDRVRAARPGALYCCDPVMGDVGRGFFVRPGIPEFMRDQAVPRADIITPNQFELDYLTGQATDTLDGVLAATAMMRDLGPKLVLVTSVIRKDGAPESVEMLVDGPDGAWIVATPRLPLDPPPNGAGDCTSALFLARYLECGDPRTALEQTAASVAAIFRATADAGVRELQIVAAQDAIAAPDIRHRAERVR